MTYCRSLSTITVSMNQQQPLYLAVGPAGQERYYTPESVAAPKIVDGIKLSVNIASVTGSRYMHLIVTSL